MIILYSAKIKWKGENNSPKPHKQNFTGERIEGLESPMVS